MPDPTDPADENSAALYSLFCGILAIPTAFLFGIGALFGVLAIVLGRAGLQRAAEGQGRQGLAIAGVALGAVAIVLAVAIVIGSVSG